MPNNKKMDALCISCQPGGDPNRMFYLPREQVNCGIRDTSHVPVEATPPELAHTTFFWLNTKRSEVGSRGKHKQIMWSYYTCCVGYRLPKPWSAVITLERDKNRKFPAMRCLQIWELRQRSALSFISLVQLIRSKQRKRSLTLSSGTPATLSNRQLLVAKLRRTRARALGKTDWWQDSSGGENKSKY